MSTTDIAALRVYAREIPELHFDIDEGDESLYAHDERGDIYPVDEMPREAKDAIVALLNAAPVLLDELEELREYRNDFTPPEHLCGRCAHL